MNTVEMNQKNSGEAEGTGNIRREQLIRQFLKTVEALEPSKNMCGGMCRGHEGVTLLRSGNAISI